jgi:hypothetical protein
MARDECRDRVCHRDKFPATISPTRYWSVANPRVGHPSARHLLSTRGGKPKRQANGTAKLADSAVSDSGLNCRWGRNRFGRRGKSNGDLSDFKERVFEPEAVTCMARAYEGALVALRLTNRQDPFTEIVAKKIVEIADTGERDPERLRDRALEELGRKDM